MVEFKAILEEIFLCGGFFDVSQLYYVTDLLSHIILKLAGYSSHLFQCLIKKLWPLFALAPLF